MCVKLALAAGATEMLGLPELYQCQLTTHEHHHLKAAQLKDVRQLRTYDIAVDALFQRSGPSSQKLNQPINDSDRFSVSPIAMRKDCVVYPDILQALHDSKRGARDDRFHSTGGWLFTDDVCRRRGQLN